MFLRSSITLAAAILPATALAQPSMDSLWPNADGARWEFTRKRTVGCSLRLLGGGVLVLGILGCTPPLSAAEVSLRAGYTTVYEPVSISPQLYRGSFGNGFTAGLTVGPKHGWLAPLLAAEFWHLSGDFESVRGYQNLRVSVNFLTLGFGARFRVRSPGPYLEACPVISLFDLFSEWPSRNVMPPEERRTSTSKDLRYGIKLSSALPIHRFEIGVSYLFLSSQEEFRDVSDFSGFLGIRFH